MRLISAAWYCCFFSAFVLLPDLNHKNALIKHYHCSCRLRGCYITLSFQAKHCPLWCFGLWGSIPVPLRSVAHTPQSL